MQTKSTYIFIGGARALVPAYFISVVILFTALAVSIPAQVIAQPELNPAEQLLIEQLAQDTQDNIRISFHSGTGKVRYIGTDPSHPILRPAGVALESKPEEVARSFLVQYGKLFGLTNPATELTLMKTHQADRDRSFVRFQQVYDKIPVFGGELVVQVDSKNNILSANGEVLPAPDVNPVPLISAEEARKKALTVVAKTYGMLPTEFIASDATLWLYNPVLLGAPGLRSTSLVWKVEVEPIDLLPIRECVLVDASLGVVVLHFNQVADVKNRATYDAQGTSNLPGVLMRSEGDPPTGNADVDNAYEYAGDVYDFYYTYHGRDSIDDQGMELVSTVNFCPYMQPCPYANAFWNGTQMVYGQGYSSADDVVAHEMTHGVTQFTSRLFYYMQSGAINEALSDIWGEFVDLTNGKGNDDPSVRWLLGEDLPDGAIRSLSDPTQFNLPDRMSSPYYYCGTQDQGGVHTNSGVASKSAYLMVDGDSFNGYTVSGLGLEKTAKIWYEVQTNLLTSASDYQDLYDYLQQACINLIGTAGITQEDCLQVKNAVDATEMNQPPPECTSGEAPLCDSGCSPQDIFYDDLENYESGNWQTGAIAGSNKWYYPQTASPYGFDATYATSGEYNFWGYDQPHVGDYYIAMTFDVTLPLGSSYMHFKHSYAFEDSAFGFYDGGVVEYSTNGGITWIDAGHLFTHNGYTGIISSNYDNPLSGRQAFVGDSFGYISSKLDLTPLAGKKVRFRFRIGSDNSGDDYGWFIDDIRIYTCDNTEPTPAPTPTPTPTATPTPSPTPTPIPTGTPSPGLVRYTFDSGTEGWTFSGAIRGFEAPQTSSENGSLGLTPAGSTNCFGYWFSPDVQIEDGRTYRVSWTVESSSTDPERTLQFRLRVNQKGAGISWERTHSSINNHQMPSVGNPKTYNLVFEPEVDGPSSNVVVFSFDVMSFDPNDDVTSWIYLKELVLEEVAVNP